jgi:hypothetical protein
MPCFCPVAIIPYYIQPVCVLSQSICECLSSCVVTGVSHISLILWLKKLKMLWLVSLLIVFILFTAPTGRPTFFFFIVTVDYFPSGVFSPCVLYASLSVAEIRKSVNSVCLAAFTRSISFTLAGYSADHDVWLPPWHAAQRLWGAGDPLTPAHISVLWLPLY